MGLNTANESVESICRRLDALERENEYLRAFITDLQWLNVTQVAKALGCSERTVFRLYESGRLKSRKEGKKPMCHILTVRSYLTGKKFEESEIKYRIMGASQPV